MNPSKAFWEGRRVLVTGHSGFKGAWLTLWLHRLGATVVGVSLPPTEPSLFTAAAIGDLCESVWCDIRQPEPLRDVVRTFRPDVVFHLAAQALVRPSYADPIGTWHTNVMGTAHVLEAIRDSGTTVCVVVTTDKVYRQEEEARPFTERDPLGGHDPYSASKAACELLTESYRLSFLGRAVAVATARAGNVVGGGDWGRDRLIPDAIRAWQAGVPLVVRRPEAVRPWQFVLEPLHGYLRLAERLWDEPGLAGAYNFGPSVSQRVSVREIVALALEGHGSGDVEFASTPDALHEAALLSLDSSAVERVLGSGVRWSPEEAVRRTIAWYTRAACGSSARALCEADLQAFEDVIR